LSAHYKLGEYILQGLAAREYDVESRRRLYQAYSPDARAEFLNKHYTKFIYIYMYMLTVRMRNKAFQFNSMCYCTYRPIIARVYI